MGRGGGGTEQIFIRGGCAMIEVQLLTLLYNIFDRKGPKGPKGKGLLPRGGGDSHMKQTGMLVVSLRGVSFGF